MKKDNNRGSTIIMAIEIVLVIFIILGTALAIATSYQKRAVIEHARKQAYLNGVSVVDTIAGQIANVDNSSFLPTSQSSVVNISSVDLPEGFTGDISAKIFYSSDNSNVLYIQVSSIYNKQTEKVQLSLKNIDGKWYKVNYSKVGDENNEN